MGIKSLERIVFSDLTFGMMLEKTLFKHSRPKPIFSHSFQAPYTKF